MGSRGKSLKFDDTTTEEQRLKIEGDTLEESFIAKVAGVHRNIVSLRFFLPNLGRETAGMSLIFLDVVDGGRELEELGSLPDGGSFGFHLDA